uniref:Uncharacterized protein n=1 Tax=Aegilops tauschii subsp. strangulata TaxID=200361 RepID=A0A453FW39_AEGTS
NASDSERTFIEYGFPQNSIGIYEIEYGILARNAASLPLHQRPLP